MQNGDTAMARPRKEIDVAKLFRTPRILTLDQLVRMVASSRATIQRRLDEHGYYSSYNHAGMFLTIPEVAEFDSRGLWFFKAARFSKHGNLRATVEHFVHSSDAGLKHAELASILGVRVHNPLFELVSDGSVARERLGGSYVYVTSKARTQKQQIKRRAELLKEAEKPRPSSRQIIATLLALIADRDASPAEIATRCQRGGTSISRQVVEAIFEQYDLGKKRAP